MSGWIDPLGVRTLRQLLNADADRAHVLIALTEHDHRPMITNERRRRRLTKYRARLSEIGRILAAIEQIERPGIELLPHKLLVQEGDAEGRRTRCNAILAVKDY